MADGKTRTMVDASGQIYDIPLDKVKEAAEKQGMEFTVPFVDKNGDVYDIPKSRVSGAEASGLKPVPMTETKPEYEVKQERPMPTSTESGARGAVQGLTMGNAPKISAAFESMFSKKTYDQALAESEENFDRAERANPLAFNVGQGVGTVAGLVVPGGAAAKGIALAAKGVGTGARLAQGSMTVAKTIAEGSSRVAKPVGRVLYKAAKSKGGQYAGALTALSGGSAAGTYFANKGMQTVAPAVEQFEKEITE